MKKVLAIGAGYEQVYAIKKAKELGLYVIAIDGNKKAEGFKIADEKYIIDIGQKEKILEIAKSCNIKAVLPVPIGYYITTVGYINEYLKLKGPKIFATQTCADKKLLKHFFEKYKFNYAKQITTSDGAFQEELLKMKYPVIVKPRKGSGSKGVKVLYSLKDIMNYLSEVGNIYGEMLIEEFIEGKEYGIDVIVQQGRITFLNIREKRITSLPYRQEVGYISPADLTCQLRRKVEVYLHNVIERLDIEDSLLHADIIIDTSKEIFIIDIAPRPAGLNIVNRILKYNTQEEIISEWIKYIALGSTLKDITIKHYVGLEYIDIENTVIDKLPDLKQFKQKYKIKEAEIMLYTGQKLGVIQNGLDLNKRGFFIVVRDDYKTVKEDSLEIIKYIKKEVKKNE